MFPESHRGDDHQENEQHHRDEGRHDGATYPLAEIIELLANGQPIGVRVAVVGQVHYRRRRTPRRSSQGNRQLQRSKQTHHHQRKRMLGEREIELTVSQMMRKRRAPITAGRAMHTMEKGTERIRQPVTIAVAITKNLNKKMM